MYTFAIASDTTLIVTDVNQCTPTRSVADLRTLHHTLLAQYLNENRGYCVEIMVSSSGHLLRITERFILLNKV